jgi:hypothetical protein
MKIFAFAAGFFLLVGCAFAADIDGKYSGPYSGAGMDMTKTYTFKAEGAKLTGTAMSSLDNKENPIKEGKIDGKTISFIEDVDFQGMSLKIKYKGTVVSKDEIKLTFETDMGGGGMGGPGGGGPGMGGPGGPGAGGPGGGAAQASEIVVKRVVEKK